VRHISRSSVGGFTFAAGVVLAAAQAYGETSLSVYTGTSYTWASDVRIQQPASHSDAIFHGVSWDANPFKPAPYYGIRINYFFPKQPQWGVGLDYTHYKAYARTGDTVHVEGTWQGAAINEVARLDERVQKLDITHGVNIAALDVLYRWQMWRSAAFPRGRLRPYLGAGLAYYVLNSENTINGQSHTSGYQGSGFGYQLLAGVQYGLTSRFSLFVETKYNQGNARVDVADQGHAETRLRTVHAIAGVSYDF
jgi:opacity protein-like surface antigen